MLKRTGLLPLVALAFLSPAASLDAQAAAPSPSFVPRASSSSSFFLTVAFAVSDKEQDGLLGPVRRVRTETTKLNSKEGKLTEGPRVVLETATYDIKGNKTDNAYFLAAGGTLTGKEVYKYDERGNIIEMTLFNTDGSLLSKETYTYEFDAVGNWTKMTTSVAVVENGKVNYEPTEITYRVIAYYLEEATAARMAQANTSTASSVAASQPAAPQKALSMPMTNANSSAAPASANVASANAADQTKAGASLKTNANGVAASTPTSAKKTPASAVVLPELSVDKSKVYAVSNPAVGSVAGATDAAAPVVRDDGEAPVRPLAKAPVKPVSGGVLNGKALSLPAPVYPTTARLSRASGVVSVEVVIDVTGKVISAKAVGGPVLLQQPAERAAMQARFSPTLLSGQPVKVFGTITYNFSLNP
ncbi:MAG TPA: TonB family protein [Pyrinomonadaceae bacterium]|jgi:TonB family protein